MARAPVWFFLSKLESHVLLSISVLAMPIRWLENWRSCLSLIMSIFFCIVCPSIYGFSLPLW